MKKQYILDSLALIAGALLTLAFAPFDIFPLAVLAPAVLLRTWIHATPRRAFFRGFLFGVGHFATGVYWVYISIHTFGETPIWLAGFITAGFVAILSLFPAFNGYLLRRYFHHTFFKQMLAFPFLWFVLEWVRSFLFTGFPWLFLGTSQISSPLKGFAPVVGVYGVTFLTALCSSLIVYAAIEWKQRKAQAVYFSLFSIALIWMTGTGLSLITWTKPFGKPIQVSLIQGNIEQSVKWSPDQILPTLNTYQELTQAHWDSKIIIWPESAIPLLLQNVEDYVGSLAKEASDHHSALIIGVPVRGRNYNEYYNSVFAFGEGSGFYTKHRLVPFGEYVPFRKIAGKLLQFMDIPMSDFVAGTEKAKPLNVNGIKIAAYICYEIAYPIQVLSTVNDSNILLTVSNDGWFGDSIAQAQHFQIAQMRALELGKPLLFVSNTGFTGIISPQGKILQSIPPFTQAVLTADVQPMTGHTPWQKLGTNILFLIFFTTIYIIYKIKRRAH